MTPRSAFFALACCALCAALSRAGAEEAAASAGGGAAKSGEQEKGEPPAPQRPPRVPTPLPPGPETRPEAARPGEIPSPELPLPEKERARITFVPLPVIYSDPNIGVGGGFMPVVLFHPEERIEAIFAPSIDYNAIESASLISRVFWYPTRREELFVYNAISLSEQADHEVRFHGRDRGVDLTDFVARAYYYNDITQRFFGFGADTREDDETNYTQREIGIEGDVGYRFWDRLRAAGTFRYRRTTHEEGGIDDLDDTTDVFPDVPGVGAEDVDTFALGLRLTLDLRDNAAIPNAGFYADLVGEAADEALGSEFSFWRWIIDARAYVPLFAEKWVHVMRVVHHGIDADPETPFWELPTLGGAVNLRGFGVGRFTDENYLLFSMEERLRVYEMVVRENRLILEYAGFADLGRVYGRGGGLDDKDWQLVVGAGARLLLPDSAIVARIDVGLGSEGPAVFVVLGYPF